MDNVSFCDFSGENVLSALFFFFFLLHVSLELVELQSFGKFRS